MMEMTAIGMGLMMTGVAVVVGGLVFEAMFLMLSRALRVPPLAASFELGGKSGRCAELDRAGVPRIPDELRKNLVG